MPEPLLVGDVFRNAARAVPDRVAVVIGDASLTFGQLDRLSNEVVECLLGQGHGPGDRIAVAAETAIDTVVLFAGVAKAGAVFVPVNPALRAEEVRSCRPLARIWC